VIRYYCSRCGEFKGLRPGYTCPNPKCPLSYRKPTDEVEAPATRPQEKP